MKNMNAPDPIPFSRPYLSTEESRLTDDALRSTWISDGPYIAELEKGFAGIHGVPCAVSSCNGTAALEMALRALDLDPGDEVIVPGFTFPAPFNMVLAVGAKPVYADIDPATWCIDPDSVRALITPKTRAVIAVHIYGNICDMPALKKIAAEHGLALIEDCAQSVFSTRDGKYAGTFGDLGCFSFQATKTITTGEGGMVVASDPGIEKSVRLLRNHGMSTDRRYWHDALGFNFRMTNLQAAMGCAQLHKSGEIIAKKKDILQWYTNRLAGAAGVVMQAFDKNVDPVVWSVGVRVDPAVFGGSRDGLIGSLSERGIETRCGFYPPSLMPLYAAPPLPVSEAIAANVLVLPAFTALTEAGVDRVCAELLGLRK